MLDLDKLMRLHNLATPGPWKVATWYGGNHTIRPKQEPEKSLGKIERKQDAAYICTACNAVPELVARIRELESEMSAQSLKQVSALTPCRIASNNNSTPPEWIMRRFTEVK